MRTNQLRLRYFEMVMQARKGYIRAMEPICSQWDLTHNELDVILFLFNNPQLDRASDVSLHRGMAKSHVSLSVASLEAKGLLLRQPDEQDRRTVHLKLLEDALDIARQGRDTQHAFFSRIYAGLTPEELEIWAGITEKVSANIARLD